MDAERFRRAYRQLEALDERLTHKLRARDRMTLGPPTQRQLEQKVKDLSAYSIELKEVVRELFLAIAGRPEAAPRSGGEGSEG